MGALPKEGEASTVSQDFSFHLSLTFPATFLAIRRRLRRSLPRQFKSSASGYQVEAHMRDEDLRDGNRTVGPLVILHARHQWPGGQGCRVGRVDWLRRLALLIAIADLETPALLVCHGARRDH